MSRCPEGSTIICFFSRTHAPFWGTGRKPVPAKAVTNARMEQADKELAGVAAAVLARIDAFAHASTKAEAKDKFNEAQRAWALLRDLDCQAESAFMWLRSAHA